jgi:hypothetical protein
MKACEKLNIDITNIYPIIIGKTRDAESEWNKNVGFHISTLRNMAWGFLTESGLYDEMLEDDKYFTRRFGKGEDDVKIKGELDSSYLDIHYPNGIMRLYYKHAKHVLFFRNPEYSQNMKKPVDPGPCTSGCSDGSFYNFGTLYPCSQCTEIERYELKLKDWKQQKGEELC